MTEETVDGEPVVPDDVPKAGDALSLNQAEMICAAVATRQENFPNETIYFSMTIVLAGIGGRFTPIMCINGEWNGLKRDIPPGEGIPKCPNGHVLMEGKGIRLGWVEDQ